MSDPFLGEIRMFAGNYPPLGWEFCHGQLLPISENDALFVLIGTIYGGDGESTFALPDLRGRVPVHQGQGAGLSNQIIGGTGGVESVTLTTQQIPNHTHQPTASTAQAGQTTPSGGVWAVSSAGASYATSAADTPMKSGIVSPLGGSQPHENMMPSLCVSFIIATSGIFPQFF